MKSIYYLLIIVFFGVAFFSCSKKMAKEKGDTTNANGLANTNEDDKTSITPKISEIPKEQAIIIEDGFQKVLKSLYGSYVKNEFFSEIPLSNHKMETTSYGVDSKALKSGVEKEPGHGTCTKTFQEPTTNNNDSKFIGDIIYEYNNYQTRGSDFIINGKIQNILEWIYKKDSNNLIRIKDNKTDTLNIKGPDNKQIELKFTTGTNNSTDNSFDKDNYKQKIIEVFQKSGFKIEFTYDTTTITLNEEQLKSLLFGEE